MPTVSTALTKILGIKHPILLAPMGSASGGILAAAVSHAGGLGFNRRVGEIFEEDGCLGVVSPLRRYSLYPSSHLPLSVIPAKAGTQLSMYGTLKSKARHAALGPDFHRDDGIGRGEK
jgi:hypothetical protein